MNSLYAHISKEKALKVVTKNGAHYHKLPLALRCDLDVFKAAVAQSWMIAHHLPDDVFLTEETARDLFLYSVQRSESVFEYPPSWAPPNVLREEFILQHALPFNGHLIEHFERAQRVRVHALTAVRACGGAFAHVYEYFNDDMEIALTAFRHDGLVLEFASERIRNDETAVLAAVQNDGLALEFASDRLKSDKQIVLAACRQSLGAHPHCLLQDDPQIICAAVHAAAQHHDHRDEILEFIEAVRINRAYCEHFRVAQRNFLHLVMGTKRRETALAKLNREGPHFDLIASFLVGGQRQGPRFKSALYLEALTTLDFLAPASRRPRLF
jgi:hypothetical protein